MTELYKAQRAEDGTWEVRTYHGIRVCGGMTEDEAIEHATDFNGHCSESDRPTNNPRAAARRMGK